MYYGSLAALPHLKQNGGALINLGSEVSEAVVPLQGMYSASKHAVKGFTDALRVEVEELDKAPVSITLVQPTAVDTPIRSTRRTTWTASRSCRRRKSTRKMLPRRYSTQPPSRRATFAL